MQLVHEYNVNYIEDRKSLKFGFSKESNVEVRVLSSVLIGWFFGVYCDVQFAEMCHGNACIRFICVLIGKLSFAKLRVIFCGILLSNM